MNIAVILSGGVGSRMGSDIPKQYIMVGGRPVISYCIERFAGSGMIDAFILAMDERWKDFVRPYVDSLDIPVWYSEPGETRQFTIYNALRCARGKGATDEDIVIIHDAVRPNVSSRVIHDCLENCRRYGAAIATVPVKDTIYMNGQGGCIANVPKRSTLRAGQTPEAFRLGKFLHIHEETSREDIAAVTGGAEFAFRCGMNVFLSEGEEINFKLTTPEDMDRFEQIVKKERRGL